MQENNIEDIPIIVYMLDYKYSGNGYYTNIYIDFRTGEDLGKFRGTESFWNRMLEDIPEEKTSSIIKINRLKSSKRLRRDAYYKLNMDMLNEENVEIQVDNESYSVWMSLLFRDEENIGDALLFQSHDPLDPSEVSYPNRIWNIDDFYPEIDEQDLHLCVNNVGQGNCNEIWDNNNKVKIVYDLGAAIHAKKDEVNRLKDKRIADYKASCPLLIISHWDLDHYHQLLAMDSDELRCFSGVLCPAKMRSATSRAIYSMLINELGRYKIYSIEDYNIKYDSPDSTWGYVYVRNNYIIYAGRNNRNINSSGIIFGMFGKSKLVMLTGDCNYKQVSEILEDCSRQIESNHISNILVVPHHGGNFSDKLGILNLPDNISPQTAAVSVDEDNNNYGHPVPKVLKMLESIGYQVDRTDENGDCWYQF